ncbi:MAG: dUTP diphosphatase [Candidatus Binatia bacterium]
MSLPPRVRVVVVRTRGRGESLELPAYQTAGAAGVDLRADVEAEVVLGPRDRCLVPTGLAVAIPPGFEGQVRPRSGLAHRHGVTVLNAPGTIDSDYRGEVQVLLVNLGSEPFTIRRGERIAQLVLAPVATIEWAESDALEATGRGSGGFGSTRR